VTVVEVEGRQVALSSLDKVLWPETGFTKRQLLDYYERIAPVLLPHLRERPLTLGRFPDGVEGPGFAQNECRGRPAWVATQPIPLKSGVVRHYCLVNDLPSLLWVANLGTIELHPYLAPGARRDHPLALVLDLDPAPPAGLAECRSVALRARDALAAVGLRCFAKTSGAAGLHVFAPLDGNARFSDTKAFARRLAETLEQEMPELVVTTQSRAARGGKVLVDWLQNDPMRSTVAPFSLRATRRPQVSTPVAWAEVEAGSAAVFEPEQVLERVERLGDLFRGVLELRQRLPASASLPTT